MGAVYAPTPFAESLVSDWLHASSFGPQISASRATITLNVAFAMCEKPSHECT